MDHIPHAENGQPAAILQGDDGYAMIWRSEILRVNKLAGAQGVAVYAYLRTRMNGSGEAWPSANRMAREFGASDDTIRRAVRLLVDGGIIEAVIRPGTSSVYRLANPTQICVHPETEVSANLRHTLRKSAEGGIRKAAYLKEQEEHNKEQVQEQQPAAAPQSRLFEDDRQALMTAWNATAKQCGLSTIRVIDGQRSEAVREAFADTFFAANWEEALEALPSQMFALGHGPTRWRLTFDVFLKSSSVRKILEGSWKEVRKSSTTVSPERTKGAVYDPADTQAANDW